MYSGTKIAEFGAPKVKRPFDVIFVVGPADAGKTTFSKALAEALKCRRSSTGEYLVTVLAEIRAKLSRDERQDAEYWRGNIRLSKTHFRPALVCLGDWFTSIQGDCLIDAALSGIVTAPVVVCGVRRRVEVHDRVLRERSDLWVSVERPGYTGADGDRFELGNLSEHLPSDVDRVLVLNEGSEDDLVAKAFGIAEIVRMRAERVPV